MNVERTISGLPERTTQDLVKLRNNVVSYIDKGTDVAGLPALLEAIDNQLLHRFQATGDGWTNGSQGEPRYLIRNGEKIAVVARLETHGANKGSYLIEVFGRALTERPRNIDQARTLAEQAASVASSSHD